VLTWAPILGCDLNVQFVLDVKIVREDELKLDSIKPTINAERVYSQARVDKPEARRRSLVRATRSVIDSEHEKQVLSHLSGLSVQGKFAEIIELQRADHFFRKIKYDLARKQLSWIMSIFIDHESVCRLPTLLCKPSTVGKGDLHKVCSLQLS